VPAIPIFISFSEEIAQLASAVATFYYVNTTERSRAPTVTVLKSARASSRFHPGRRALPP